MARELTEKFVFWLDAFGDASYDPYDLWATRLGRAAKSLYYRRPVLGHALAAPLVALDLATPGVRRFVGPKLRHPIADAHFALGFFALGRSERARTYLSALESSRAAGSEEFAWGYPFDWPSRSGLFPAGTPLVTTIPYCYDAFEAGFEETQDERYLEIMRSIGRFAAERIPVTRLSGDLDASAYSPLDRTRVVNASAYRGSLLLEAGRRFGRDEWVDAGGRNIEFVLASQADDGSWPYAADPEEDFVDNFHTCLVLKSLGRAAKLLDDTRVWDAVDAGYAFYRSRLLDETGLPVPFARAPRLTLHRRDLYDYAEGVRLATLLLERVPEAGEVLERLVADLASRWQLPDGHFATRELVVGWNKVPYHRWAQAQTFRALATIAECTA